MTRRRLPCRLLAHPCRLFGAALGVSASSFALSFESAHVVFSKTYSRQELTALRGRIGEDLSREGPREVEIDRAQRRDLNSALQDPSHGFVAHACDFGDLSQRRSRA